MPSRDFSLVRLALLGAALVLASCSDDDGGGSSGDGGPDGSTDDGGIGTSGTGGGGGNGSGRGDGGSGTSGSSADGGGAGNGGNSGTGGGGNSGTGGGGNSGTGGGDGGAGTGGGGAGTGGGGADDDCDGIDDDDDGDVDEGYVVTNTTCGAGECRRTGKLSCVDGDEVDSCVAGTPAGSDATCDDNDDDCDGDTDEDYAPVDCDGDDGDLCEEGETVCDGGDVLCGDDTGDTLDVCDGLDNDCDAASADGSEDSSLGDDCDGDDGDLCNEGTYACVGSGLQCSDDSSDDLDVCDGDDNDCDPASDDGDEDPQLGDACDGAGDSDLCQEGTYSCSTPNLVCSDATGSTTDLCDGTDEDCDAASADGSEDPAVGDPCDGDDSDLCNGGTNTCAGASGIACSDDATSLVDLCDGMDNDCDVTSADGSEDPQVGDPCDGADDGDLCEEGTYSCVSPNLACSDTTDTTVDTDCDGNDDDCDGTDDESYVSDASCGTGYCHTNNTPSSCAGGTETACQPGAQLASSDVSCDGVDDDCDSNTDEEYVPQQCGVGYCHDNSEPTVCSGGQVTACVPAAPIAATDDTCDGVDDDCDGDTDEEYTDVCNGALTGIATCVNGNPTVVDCNDTVGCTVDTCNPATVRCEFAPSDVLCTSDGFGCTNEVCVLGVGCAQVPDNQFCRDADGLLCNGLEECNPTAQGHDGDGCIPGTPPCADDQWNCTDTVCTEGAGGVTCSQVPDNGFCSDNLFCTGAETCNPSNPLRDADGCVDGPVCPGTEDGKTCTQVTCDEGNDTCSNTPIGGFCNDSNNCTTDACAPASGSSNPVTGCTFTAVDCSATPGQNECTTAVCDNSDGSCDLVTDASACNPGQACTLADGCVSCLGDAECSDGDLCNGVEHCTAGACVPGTPPPPCADDGFGCSTETCNPATGLCETILDNDVCVDSQGVCNGADACNPTAPVHDSFGCTHGAPLNCLDDSACTDNDCDPVTGCIVQDNGLCEASDTTFCDGLATCQPNNPNRDVNGCVEPFPNGIDCDQDGIACTVATCEEGTGCVETPDKTLCPCGQTCSPTLGCQNTCVPATCQGKTYACGDCLDNDNDCSTDPTNPSSGIDTGSDLNCLGPCQDNESGLAGLIPGQNNAPCKMDCYFDADSGAGNDNCQWDHECDPYLPGDEVKCDTLHDVQLAGGNPKLYCWADLPSPPRPASIPPSTGLDAYSDQPDECWLPQDLRDNTTGLCCDARENGAAVGSCTNGTDNDGDGLIDAADPDCNVCLTVAMCDGLIDTTGGYCGPLVPNGCDCFGCCLIPGMTYPIYLGSTNASGVNTCTIDVLDDPALCSPCTQVPGCLNTCETCEICVGKPLPDPSCSGGCQVCQPGQQLCGPPCGTPCPSGFFCNTGCCSPVPT